MSLSEFSFFYVQIPSFCQLLQSVLPLLIWMLSAVYHFWSYFFWTCPGILLVQHLNVKQIHTALFYSLHGKLLLLEYPVFFMILLMFNMPYRIGNQHLRNFLLTFELGWQWLCLSFGRKLTFLTWGLFWHSSMYDLSLIQVIFNIA